jgi:cell pole-organizing protein PopZ
MPLVRTHVVRDAAEFDDEVLDLADMEVPHDHEFAPGEDSPLIAETVRDAMQENLAALAMLAEPPARPQIVRSGETSLEGLTRELLRPMLAEWLEAHLPALVENLVQAEIARIVGKRR